jgi:hypothetical protein
LAPTDPEVAYLLAQAYGRDGRVDDALAFYAETARLDPRRRGPVATRDAERLRSRWLAVELEAGHEALRGGRCETALEAFERAFEIASPGSPQREQARVGYAQAGARWLVQEGLEGREDGTEVALVPLRGPQPGTPLAAAAEAFEQALQQALTSAGATVLPPSQRRRAPLVAHGTADQRLVVAIDEQGAGSRASVALRALVDPSMVRARRPEAVELDLAAESPPRDAGGAWSRISESTVLHSGDGFRVRARANRLVYLYVFNVDAGGNTTLLFPHTERFFPELQTAGIRAENPVRPREDVIVPPLGEGQPFFFTLDETTGEETLWVVASMDPVAEVEAFLPRLRSGGRLGPDERAQVDALIEDPALMSRVRDANTAEEIRGPARQRARSPAYSAEPKSVSSCISSPSLCDFTAAQPPAAIMNGGRSRVTHDSVEPIEVERLTISTLSSLPPISIVFSSGVPSIASRLVGSW